MCRGIHALKQRGTENLLELLLKFSRRIGWPKAKCPKDERAVENGMFFIDVLNLSSRLKYTEVISDKINQKILCCLTLTGKKQASRSVRNGLAGLYC